MANVVLVIVSVFLVSYRCAAENSGGDKRIGNSADDESVISKLLKARRLQIEAKQINVVAKQRSNLTNFDLARFIKQKKKNADVVVIPEEDLRNKSKRGEKLLVQLQLAQKRESSTTNTSDVATDIVDYVRY